jgi:hypothetical protein
MRVMWWMHAGAVDGFHGKRRKGVEGIVVLHWRLMVWVVSIISMPCRVVILERFLVVVVVVLVIHLQLAHVGIAGRVLERWCIRASVGTSVRVGWGAEVGWQTGICTCTVVLLYLGGVGDLRAAERIHA